MTKRSIQRNGAWKEEDKKKKAWKEWLKIKNFNCYCFGLISIYLRLAVVPFQLQAGGGLRHEPQVLGGIDL